jgi:predicted S18 family serine protease
MRPNTQLDELYAAIKDLEKAGEKTMQLSDVMTHLQAIRDSFEDIEEELLEVKSDLVVLQRREKLVYQKDNDNAMQLATAVWEFADWHTSHYEASSRLRVDVDTFLWDRVVDAAKPYRQLSTQPPRLLSEAGDSV